MYNEKLNDYLKKFEIEDLEAQKISNLLKSISDDYDKSQKEKHLLENSVERNSRQILDLIYSQAQEHNNLKDLIDRINSVFFSISLPDFKLVHISNACQSVFGYTIEEFKKNNTLWFDIIVEEDKQAIIKKYSAICAGETFSKEYRIHHKLAGVRWVETKVSPTVNAEGVLIRIDGVTSDITKRKETEILAAEGENKYRDLFETMADGIYKSTQEGKFIDVNPALVRMLGYESKEDLLSINIKTDLYFDEEEREDAKEEVTSDGISVFRMKLPAASSGVSVCII